MIQETAKGGVMKIVGDLMKAGELKEKIVKGKYRNHISVVAHLEACAVGQCDSWYHIHDDEQIPVNVGVSLKIR